MNANLDADAMRACGCPGCTYTLQVAEELFGPFAAPPPPPEPESAESRIQRYYNPSTPDEDSVRRANIGDELNDLMTLIWACEASARQEDHIDQQVENRARIDAALERRKRRDR